MTSKVKLATTQNPRDSPHLAHVTINKPTSPVQIVISKSKSKMAVIAVINLANSAAISFLVALLLQTLHVAQSMIEIREHYFTQ
jgi:hypothetical protein